MSKEHGLDNLAVIRDLEAELTRYRDALHVIAQRSRQYKESGNGQGSVIYRLAMQALFPLPPEQEVEAL